MVRAHIIVIFLVLPLSSPLCAQPDIPSLAARLDANPYDYLARQQLVQASQEARDYAGAYYHAAWLTWLAPRKYADSPVGARLLHDQRARDQVGAWDVPDPVALAVRAVNAERMVLDTCLNGAIATQAGRLRSEINDLLSRAEKVAAESGRADPVARMALARLYLVLDDCMVLEGVAENDKARSQLLQKCSSLAAAAVTWLPKSPGAHLLVAIARARLAELSNRQDLWGLAIEECKLAQALDPDDVRLSEMIWTLHLRAGNWDEARRWQVGSPDKEHM